MGKETWQMMKDKNTISFENPTLKIRNAEKHLMKSLAPKVIINILTEILRLIVIFVIIPVFQYFFSD